jgi:hypothetical protein
VVPPPHTVPHAPQLPLSVCSSTHVLPQTTWPAGHVHLPETHVWSAAQAVPHAPQLLGFEFVSTQAPSQ